MVARVFLFLFVAVAAVVVPVVRPADARPLVTSLMDPSGPGFNQPPTAASYAKVRQTGATSVRMPVSWAEISPRRPAKPRDFGDRAYHWAALDRRIALARGAGLRPIVSISGPPVWALAAHANRPSVPAFQAFADAIARRYDGGHGHPRVRYWQVWNEPNLNTYLAQAGGPAYYRRMVNAFAAAVKSVHRDNLVVAGGTAPFGGVGTYGSRTGSYGTRPLPFMREVLRKPVRFDVWAHHPYTSGGPTRHALQPGDVSLGDLGQMSAVLKSAWQRGKIRSSSRPRFWVTEFSWDSNPPDGGGLPLWLHARWVSEALYRMWSDGVSLVTWFQLTDEPLSMTPSGIWQSGLYFLNGRPKPSLQAFRFPFVAFTSGSRVSVWGRTPRSDSRRVVIEQRVNGAWRRVKALRSDRDGIFQARVKRRGGDSLRARVPGSTSRPFSLVRPKDRFVNPFGTGAAPE